MDWNKATVLVTGATGGIGHAIVRALRGRGADLVLSGRRLEVLEPLAAETGARLVAADLADAGDLRRLIAEAGDVDVLVANAALPASGALTEFEEEEIDRALAVNLRAPIVLARHLAPPMARRGRGHLVFIGSLAGKAANADSSIYSATKFGLRGFAHGLRQDLHGTGVGVSIVQPGFVRDAGMFADSGAKLPPFVGTSTPEAVAEAVAAAVERDRGEVDVAPRAVRAGAALWGLAPGGLSAVNRRLGSRGVTRQMAEGQRDKR